MSFELVFVIVPPRNAAETIEMFEVYHKFVDGVTILGGRTSEKIGIGEKSMGNFRIRSDKECGDWSYGGL